MLMQQLPELSPLLPLTFAEEMEQISLKMVQK